MSHEHKIELLAPAGAMDVVKAVIDAGCDAVYVGGKLFSMRQHGKWLNFEHDELAEVVDVGHRQGVKIYVTVNNLLTNSELGILEEHLRFLEQIGSDAIIIQDIGLLHLMRELGIQTPIHASTMMNVHNAYGASFLKQNGISRIITSRDITIAEAQRIGEKADIEVEYFLHNDMCVAQGSICYLSGIATPDSANRGHCMKPCRWQWDLVNSQTGNVVDGYDEKYLLARNDICLFHQLPELITSGIASIKIEGRARKADYLANIVGTYRKAIDRYYAEPTSYKTDFSEFEKLRKDRVRDYTTNHAFGSPSLSSIGLEGEREPRIFSIAIEERGRAQDAGSAFADAPMPDATTTAPRLAVRCGSFEGANSALENGADIVYIGGESFDDQRDNGWTTQRVEHIADASHAAGVELGIATPRILGPREVADLQAFFSMCRHISPLSVLLSNVGALEFMRQMEGGQDRVLVADFTCNVFNTKSLQHLKQSGVSRATLSLELPFDELAKIAAAKPMDVECVVHGSVTGMLMEACLLAACFGKMTKHDPCPGYCATGGFDLRDRLGKARHIATDQYCRNHVLMEKDFGLLAEIPHVAAARVSAVRIEGCHYEAALLGKITALYRKALDRVGTSDAGDASADMDRLVAMSPRELTLGAYTHTPVEVAHACESLPTNEIITYSATGDTPA